MKASKGRGLGMWIVKIAHLLWAGPFSIFLLWVSWRETSWSYLRAEPLFALVPLAGFLWLTFALGLFLDRPWAWIGSFVLCAFAFFAGIWVTLLAVVLEGNCLWELTATVVAFAILVVLIRGRHHFLRR